MMPSQNEMSSSTNVGDASGGISAKRGIGMHDLLNLIVDNLSLKSVETELLMPLKTVWLTFLITSLRRFMSDPRVITQRTYGRPGA